MNSINKIKSILQTKFGVDKAIGYSVIGSVISAAGSLVSLLLIALFLTKEEQGFYYTFWSVIAIQVFFELGFNGVIVQYAAHETAFIGSYNITENEIEKKAQSRLSSLLHFIVKWFSLMSFLLFAVLLTVGYTFFNHFGSGNEVIWKLPWFILVVNTSLSFILNPILSFIQGLGKVKDVAKYRMVQQIVNLIVLWTSLSLGLKLFSAPLAGLLSLLTLFLIVFFSEHRSVLLNIWKLLNTWKINYVDEIFPYQWKIALSWISGYFIFQMFNPVLFATDGAVVAGQMGMTMAVFNGLSGVTMSWMTTKTPTFSKLFAQKNFLYADSLFNRTLQQVLIINLMGVLSIILIVFLLHYYQIGIGERFLPIHLIIILGISVFLNQLVFSWATYLRCHKKEPYLAASIVAGILSVSSIVILGNLFGVIGLVTGYVSIVVLMKFWEYNIFIKYKRLWHV